MPSRKATCTTPTTVGYDATSVAGVLTISGFNPSGVTCGNGYTGSVSYTVCAAPGTDYSFGGCQVVMMQL